MVGDGTTDFAYDALFRAADGACPHTGMTKNELINDLGTETLTGIAEVALSCATVDASPCTGTTKNELINEEGGSHDHCECRPLGSQLAAGSSAIGGGSLPGGSLAGGCRGGGRGLGPGFPASPYLPPPPPA